MISLHTAVTLALLLIVLAQNGRRIVEGVASVVERFRR